MPFEEGLDAVAARHHGLARLGGAVFRIGHVGDLNELMLLGALAGVEMSLTDAGISGPPGGGASAAEEWFRETAAPLPAIRLHMRSAFA